MKTFLRTKTGRISSGTALLFIALLLHGCARHQPKTLSPVEYYDTNRPPVEAPASVKASDFRLSPPVVEDITVKKLPADQELFAVRFAADPRLGRTVTIEPDQKPIVLHDDGLNGDAVAGDHVYSAILPSEWDSLAAGQDHILAALEQRRGPLTVPVFRGREIVGEQTINVEELRSLRKQDIIKVLPFGAGAPTLPAPFQVTGFNMAQHLNETALFITDSNVVNDPTRTFNPCPPPGTSQGTPMGKWTFGYLMTQMANQGQTGVDPVDFVNNWLNTFTTLQTVNGYSVPARPIINQIINEWPKPNNRLDLAQAPLKLVAIVNRIDLASNSTYGAGGGAEGRFIFNFMQTGAGINCLPMPFTVILEYGVPRHTSSEISDWARQWLNLTNFVLGTPQYNDALWAITSQFTESNDDPAKPNGSALDQLRTDEIDPGGTFGKQSGGNWELREYQITNNNNQLTEVTVKQTPQTVLANPITAPLDFSQPYYFQNGPENGALVSWINANQEAIEGDLDTVPEFLPVPPAPGPGVSLLGGSAPNTGAGGSGAGQASVFWNATLSTLPINQEGARQHLSLNTCNGCHGLETGTGFRHVVADLANGPATLSGFLTGITVTVDLSGTEPPGDNKSNPPTHQYNDLARRAQVLTEDTSPSFFMKIRTPVTLATH